MKTDKKVNKALGRKKPLQTVLVKPAGPDCNIRCEYCFYLEKEQMFTDTNNHRMSEMTLDSLIDQTMRQSGKNINFVWQGGEPLLMGQDFFKKIISLQMKYGSGHTVGNGLQTNGLLINKSWIQFLQSTNWLVGLSLDGPKHIHDHYRRSATGSSVWQKVVDSATNMIRADVAVNALTVVNNYSVRFPEEIYTFHKKLGLIYMQFIPCVEGLSDNEAPKAYNVSADSYGTFLCTLLDLWLDDFKGGFPTTSIRLFDSLLNQYLGNPTLECTYDKECGSYLLVEHNGDVYSCDFFVEPKWRLGNIHERELQDMLNGPKQKSFGCRKMDLPDECNKCKWIHLCHGGCVKDREPVSHHNQLCSAYKQFFEYSKDIFQTLSERFKQNSVTS